MDRMLNAEDLSSRDLSLTVTIDVSIVGYIEISCGKEVVLNARS